MCKYALKHSVFFLEAAPSFSFYCPFRAPVKCAMMKGEWKRSVKHVKQPRNPRRLVVKVGTSTLTRETGSLNLQNMEHLARVLADLEGMGYQPVLVSSGAIGIGTKKLRLGERPTELRMKQAAAAVGQCRMMHIYDKLFAEYNRTVAQILLTGEDVESPVRSEHLHNTFEALLELGVIPVVNENDSVSSAEIETGQCKVLGDNDTLSAIVARLCGAGLLVLFSDIDGLYDADPRTHPDARLIHQVEAITPELRAMAGGLKLFNVSVQLPPRSTVCSTLRTSSGPSNWSSSSNQQMPTAPNGSFKLLSFPGSSVPKNKIFCPVGR